MEKYGVKSAYGKNKNKWKQKRQIFIEIWFSADGLEINNDFVARKLFAACQFRLKSAFRSFDQDSA